MSYSALRARVCGEDPRGTEASEAKSVTLKRGKGFQLPKYHVRQFRHPKEMEKHEKV